MAAIVSLAFQRMHWPLVLALVVVLGVRTGVYAQTCQSVLSLNLTRLLPIPTDYTFKGEGVTNYSPLHLEAGTCHVWTLQQNQLQGLSCGQQPQNEKSFIVIEVRRSAGTLNYSGPTFPLDVAVNAAFQQDGKYYLSKPFRDATAIDYARPYHQVVVPATVAANNTPYQWWITVANPNNGSTFMVTDYTVSASCLDTPKSMPCPQPIPESTDCSGHGKCVPADSAPSEGAALAPVQCMCDDGWGDYACQKIIEDVGSPTWSNLALAPGYWKYYHIKLPEEYQNTELLVELEAVLPESKPVPWRILLCVKPYGPFGVPWMPDLSAYCDVTSYLLSQLRHFKVLARNMLAAQDYYIAVYHRDYVHDAVLDKAINAPAVLKEAPVAITPAELRLRVTVVALTVPAPSPKFLCPWDCNNAGTCVEGTQAAQWNRYLGAMLPFTCICEDGNAGPLCTFTQSELDISMDALTANTTMTLQAGNWAQFLVKIASPAHFFSRPGITFSIRAEMEDQNMSATAVVVNDTMHRSLWLRIDPPSWTPYASPFTALSQGAQVYDRVIGVNATLPLNIPYREYWWPLFYNGSLPLPGGLFVPSDGVLAKVSVYNNPYISQVDETFTLQLQVQSSLGRPKPAPPKVPTSDKPPPSPHLAPVKPLPVPPSTTRRGQGPLTTTDANSMRNKTIILPASDDGRRSRSDSARTVGFIIGVSVGCAAAALATAGWIIGHARSRRLRRQQELESQAFQRSQPPMQGGDDRLGPNVRVFMGGLPALIVDTFPTYQYMPGHKEEDPPSRSSSPNPVARLLRSGRNGFKREKLISSQASDVDSVCATPKEGGKASSIAASESEGGIRTMCTVCLDPFQPGDIVRILPCSHQFHQMCIDQWLARQASCPTCRAGFMPPNVAEMMRSIRLAQAYEQQARLRRSMPAPAPAPPPGGSRGQSRRHGGWLGALRLGRNTYDQEEPEAPPPLSAQAQSNLRSGDSMDSEMGPLGLPPLVMANSMELQTVRVAGAVGPRENT